MERGVSALPHHKVYIEQSTICIHLPKQPTRGLYSGSNFYNEQHTQKKPTRSLKVHASASSKGQYNEQWGEQMDCTPAWQYSKRRSPSKQQPINNSGVGNCHKAAEEETVWLNQQRIRNKNMMTPAIYLAASNNSTRQHNYRNAPRCIDCTQINPDASNNASWSMNLT